jgi:AraC family transcriptional regulator, ethanolamine operon transcriptional activator
MPETALLPLLGAASSRVADLHSRDAAEHAGRLTGWTLRIEQFSAGRFSGHLTVLHLDHVQIIRERTSQVLMKQGMAWPGARVFSLPMAASGQGHFNGHLLPFPCPLVNDGGDLPALMTPRYLDVTQLVMDRQWLAGYFAGIGEQRLADDLAAGRHFRVHISADDFAAMQRVIAEAFDVCGRTNAFDFAQSRNELQGVLLRFMAKARTPGRSISMSSVTSQKKIADRALGLALSRRQDPPSIDDLCRHVGVSRRSLQDCFQDTSGISPSQFLRVARFNAVRRELKALATTAQRVSIGDVAASWGF